MPTGSNMLPIGLGGDAALRWSGRLGDLPPCFCGERSVPVGMADPVAEAAEEAASLLGATLRGRTRLGSTDGWWEAECSEDEHESNDGWPDEINLAVGGQSFVIEAEAIEQMAEGDDECESDEDELPIASMAYALEKLAARLPARGARRHAGVRVDMWELTIDATESPWRVTSAKYTPTA